MRHKTIVYLATCLLALIAAACQPAILSTPGVLTPTAPAVATADPTATSLPRAQGVEAPTVTPTVPAQPDASHTVQVKQAVSDLADRLSIEADQVKLVEVEAVEWPDASLGCPQPGMMYAQVITPGYRIVLEVDGEPYAYHGAADRPPALCAPDPTPQADPALQALVKQATDDLAARLGIQAAQIDLVEVEQVEWPDASLGCPQPGMMYAQVITPGYRIVLEAGGQAYEVHTDTDSSVVLCEDPGAPPDPAGDGSLPLFVEMIVVSLPLGASSQDALDDLPPNGVYVFDEGSHTLRVRPSIDISPQTQVLVGQTTVLRMRDQSHASGALFQVPPSRTGPLEVIALDADTGTLTLEYGAQVFDLPPGSSRSFKQAGSEGAIEITVIAHRGQLAAIEPLPDARAYLDAQQDSTS
jgi:hypothetical protein